MYRKTFLSCMLGVALSAIGVGEIGAQEPAYTVAQAYALHRDPNGIEGTVQLLIDKRLTGAVQDELWGKGDWSFVFPPGSKLHDEFAATPPHKAKLRIAGGNGKTITERDLETPLAKLKAWNAASIPHEIFLLSQDYSAGIGSYNGPVTTLLKVSDSGFHDIEALNVGSQQKQTIRLMKSLKSDWQARDRGNGGEILSVSCKPGKDGSFVIEYIRYCLDKGQWLAYKREAPGIWESDEPFPDRSEFP